MLRLLIVIVLFHISSGIPTGVEVVELSIDKSAIPEGIAIDHSNGDFYLSSLHLDKIIRADRHGRLIEDTIGSRFLGYTAGVGMEIRDGNLFALGSDKRGPTSILLRIGLGGVKTIAAYRLEDKTPSFFNDLALDRNLNAYITDTNFSRIYKYDSRAGRIALFVEDPQIKYPNGIAISSDETKLFVDSYGFGVRIVDIKSKKVLNEIHQSSKRGFDGLKYYKNSLYGIVNEPGKESEHGLYRLRLGNDDSEIVGQEPVLVNHPKLDMPTTFAIIDGYAYVLANSQLKNLDQETNTIIDERKLTPTYLLKVKLQH